MATTRTPQAIDAVTVGLVDDVVTLHGTDLIVIVLGNVPEHISPETFDT